jgi:hypothetical protein
MKDEQNLLQADLAPEKEASPEAPVEAAPEQQDAASSKEAAPASEPLEPVETSLAVDVDEVSSRAPVAVVQKDEITKAVEDILSDDLTDLFLRLPPEKKLSFKTAGEEVAGKIKIMMDSGKVKAKKILELIRDWLRIVPGVNKFFLEQEAKIKTDKLMEYYKESQKTDQNVL